MLSKFHKNIIIFFCVLLIVISIIFYRNFLYLLSTTSFPKRINRCPDHWDFSGNNTEHKCFSTHLNKLDDSLSVIDLKQTVTADEAAAATSAGAPIVEGENYLTKGAEYKSNHKLDKNFDFKNVYKKNNYCGLYAYSKKNNLQWSGITDANYTKYC
tara:strand:- start:65 stop:532 length:468 start_codon:yes stop_codon:yes gene_type:complete